MLAPAVAGGLRDLLRLRLLRCLMRNRTAEEEPEATATPGAASSAPALDTLRAAMRSFSGSCGCSGCRTMENSRWRLPPRTPSSSEKLDEQDVDDEQLDEDEDDEEDEASLLASLLTLLLRALRWHSVPLGERGVCSAAPSSAVALLASAMDSPAPVPTPHRYVLSLPPSASTMVACHLFYTSGVARANTALSRITQHVHFLIFTSRKYGH